MSEAIKYKVEKSIYPPSKCAYQMEHWGSGGWVFIQALSVSRGYEYIYKKT